MQRRQPQLGTPRRVRGLIAALIVLCLAPLVLLTWLTLSLSAKAVRNQVDARVANNAGASAVYVREQMESLSELVSSYAQRPTLIAAMRRSGARRDGRAIAFHLAELQRARNGISVAFATEPDGRLVGVVPHTPSIVGKDFSFRDWYRGVTAGNRPYVSEAYETAATGHARVVGAAVQVRAQAPGGGQGPVVGILVAAYGLDTIQRFVDDFAAAQGVLLTVTDQRGVVVAAAGASPTGLQSRRDDPLVQAALQRRSGISERTTSAGRVVSAYEPIGGLDWTVTADVPTGTAFAPIGALRRTVLTIGAVIGLVILAGLALAARAMRGRARSEQRLREGQAALEQAKRDADRANRAKSEFLSRMSHELRTPLNAILGFGQLLQLDDLTEQQEESVDHMLRGGRHLLGLINEVLDISRIESGSLSLSPERVDVLELVKDTVDLIRPLAAEREIEVQTPSATGRPLAVEADHQRLKQVLLNLASNAVKYNHHAGSIRVACQAPSPGRVAIAVQDSGPGIPADKLARLFTPFDRLGAEQTDIQGTGMGLALSKGLMEAMDGSLTAASVEGRGTTFTIELPEAAGPAGPQGAAPVPPPVAAPGAGGDQQTVLYVEDNPSNLRLVERVLGERGGVRLLTTTLGEEVQGLVLRHRPELVLLDMHLPDLDGEEVLRRLQADPRTADVPVVGVSADVTPAHIQRVLAAGAREYLTKPLDVARFRAAVDSLLSRAASRP
jgi:signal transduction histidine kinase/ActR/RegA family two-component response regulator